MADPMMKRTAGDAVELKLAVWGGKGKTVFCVHGISGSCRCWDNVANILLPEQALDKMLRDIPDAKYVDIPGSNHYSIVMQPDKVRDATILDFLE